MLGGTQYLAIGTDDFEHRAGLPHARAAVQPDLSHLLA
jgi:hypothetical protein